MQKRKEEAKGPAEMRLSVHDLYAGYSKISVLWGMSLEVEIGQKIALVGSNGGGKSTLLKTISGILKPYKGAIYFDGWDITQLKAPEIVARGISLIPEGYKLFSGMTVQENLFLGAYQTKERGAVIDQMKRVYEIFPELSMRKNQLAGTLSGGQQQMCSIGRGLMSNPKLLLIDELSLGLAPLLVETLVDKINEIHRSTQMSIILVEQDVETAFSIADFGYVIETGRVTLRGAAKDILEDPKIMQSYLGG
jgi:branched-chain amino acid transport system ATP-binding protein